MVRDRSGLTSGESNSERPHPIPRPHESVALDTDEGNRRTFPSMRSVAQADPPADSLVFDAAPGGDGAGTRTLTIIYYYD